jgi:hypothetical protein
MRPFHFHTSKMPTSNFPEYEVVGKWVWLDVSPARKPVLASVLWALGFVKSFAAEKN